jgi:HORMA domain
VIIQKFVLFERVASFLCFFAKFIQLEMCSILYNRGVYPEESFSKVKKYGLTMLLTQDEGVKSFITNLTSQLSGALSFSF